MFPRWAAVMTAIFLVARLAPGSSPAQTADATDTSTLLRVFINAVLMLDTAGDIHTIIIANPQIADASVLSPRKLYLLGKKPGQTSLTVVGTHGESLLDVTVMVAPSDQGVVTVDRGTKDHGMTESTLACSPRCVVEEENKSGSDTSGAAPPTPPSPPSGPSQTPTDTPSGPAPTLKPPALQVSP